MKDFASSYLNKHQLRPLNLTEPPSANIGFIVVIPVLCEPDIVHTLGSIWNCTRPSCNTEVLIVVNSSEKATGDIVDCNRRTIETALEWIAQHQDESLKFFVINVSLPDKDAGVGLARKIGMDEAIRRFNEAGNSRGFILSFDADSTCDPDYFSAIEDTISRKPATKGFNVYFEHPVMGTQFPERIYRGIVQYELHLRYVNMYLRYSGFPYAIHTIGSCFGVRADIYASQGGMNKRKGGEDFYFLHKIAPLGDFEIINTTRVIPSPRDSFRVPFGTGPVVSKLAESGSDMLTYDPRTFNTLKVFFQMIPLFYRMQPDILREHINHLPENIVQFLELNNYSEAIGEINSNSGSPETFYKRFYRWFDAFRTIKYLNYSAMHYFPKIPVVQASVQLLKLMNFHITENDALSLLNEYRKIERKDYDLL